VRYVTFERDGRRSWGVVLDDRVLDLPALAARVGRGPLPDDLLGFVQAGDEAASTARAVIEASRSRLLEVGVPLAAVRLLAPIPRPPKNVICIGLNYEDHAAEGGHPRPEAPVYFTKAANNVIGPEAPVVADHRVTQKLDWEVELAVVVGRGGRFIPAERALDHVFGYTVLNDISARDLQRGRGQWFLGKSLATGCPIGPWIVDKEEVPDPHALEIALRVNGVTKQHANTRLMIFSVGYIIQDLSAVFPLEPGDIIATGTPAGVGFARKPPEFLQPGDLVEAEIERIGVLRNPVVAPSE